MSEIAFYKAVCAVPAGRWAIGVSGGGDSVALLRLLHERADLTCHLVHLNHQTRGAESDADAAFAHELAAGLNLKSTIARRDEIESRAVNLPRNRSARFRALRLELLRSAVKSQQLDGAILAHHADDQAETVFYRLLRGSGYIGLTGMSKRARIGGLLILRPLLEVRRAALREYLREIGQPWREDQSNLSPAYARNRIRAALTNRDELHGALCELGESCAALRRWVQLAAPRLPESFSVRLLASAPSILSEEAARRWLAERGVRRDQVSPRVVAELIDMASDAATSPRRDFPGNVRVHRKRGIISAA